VTIVRAHYGQHGDNCYGCKLKTLSLDTGEPKTHAKGGDPWKDNPVADRIRELSGTEIDTDSLGRS
jgi:hypothetical protein